MRGYLLGTTLILFLPIILTAMTVLQREHLMLIAPCVSDFMSNSFRPQQGHLISTTLSSM
jgi:hypothetical protein